MANVLRGSGENPGQTSVEPRSGFGDLEQVPRLWLGAWAVREGQSPGTIELYMRARPVVGADLVVGRPPPDMPEERVFQLEVRAAHDLSDRLLTVAAEIKAHEPDALT